MILFGDPCGGRIQQRLLLNHPSAAASIIFVWVAVLVLTVQATARLLVTNLDCCGHDMLC